MKSKNVMKQEGDDNLSTGPPREGMEFVSLSNKNYFTRPIMDVWPQILKYVTDPKDVFTLINTAPVFRSLLENRKGSALMSLVLPVLMKKKHLEPRDILNGRLISKSVKVSVDDALVEQQPDWVPDSTYLMSSYYHEDVGNSLQRLLDLSQDFAGNPFILRNAWFTLEKDVGNPQHYVNILQILHRFGHQLYTADFTVQLFKSPRTAMDVLKQALSYLPNVKRLELTFLGHRVRNALKWNNFRTCHRQFPILKSLKVLFVSYSSSYEDYTLLPASSFVRPILLAYRKQITCLFCESYVFRGASWKSFRFRQLTHLLLHFVTDVDTETISETFRNVAKLDCPQLMSLTLFKRKSRFIITREMFEALDHFRNTLKELNLLGDIEEGSLQLFQVDPANIREFPQMTTLRLDAVNVGTGLMHLFRVQFPKLEELHFRRSLDYLSVEPSFKKIRNDYFSIFPNLKRIIWNGSPFSKGEQRC